MNDKDFENSFQEVYIILNNLSNINKEKIPKEVFEYLENFKNDEFDFKYDNSKSIDEQNVSDDATMFLACIYHDFLCNEEEKNEIEQIWKENNEKIFDPFKNTRNISEEKLNQKEKSKSDYNLKNNVIAKKKKQSLLEKIFENLRKIFKKNY